MIYPKTLRTRKQHFDYFVDNFKIPIIQMDQSSHKIKIKSVSGVQKSKLLYILELFLMK